MIKSFQHKGLHTIVGLHALKGTMANRWSVTVSGNWRLTFEFREGNTYVLDYEDYH